MTGLAIAFASTVIGAFAWDIARKWLLLQPKPPIPSDPTEELVQRVKRLEETVGQMTLGNRRY